MIQHHAPAALLFDVDGTLVDTYDLYLEAYRRALEPVLRRVPERAEFIARAPSSERHFLQSWVGAERAEEVHIAMGRHYDALHTELCGGLYPGIETMLATLRAEGHRIGVVTGKGRQAWEVTARALTLGDFAVVVTEDDVGQPKPDPAGLLRALEALQLEPAHVIYIGDSLGDLAAAQAIGMPAGAALWPKTGPGERLAFLEAVRDYSPRWLLETPEEVMRLLR